MQTTSRFPFENFMQKLKNFVKGKRFPLNEMLKRYNEWLAFGFPSNDQKPQKISCVPKDSCFRTENGVVFLQKKVDNEKYIAEFISYDSTQNFYQMKTCPSQFFGTYYIS